MVLEKITAIITIVVIAVFAKSGLSHRNELPFAFVRANTLSGSRNSRKCMNV